MLGYLMPHGSRGWPLVYIASPYTIGDTATNVARQVEAGHQLLDMQISPVVPTLNHFMQFKQHQDEETWMQMDFAIVQRCDALLRLPGESKGADREVALCYERCIPVYYTLDRLVKRRDFWQHLRSRS